MKKTATRRKPATAPRRRRATVKTVTRRTTRRRTLSSKTAVKNTAMEVLTGAVGGALAGFVLENVAFIKNQSDTNKALIIGAVAIASGVITKKPAIAAGMAGVAAVRLLKGVNVLADRGSMIIPPISEGIPAAMIPYGLASDGMVDYAGLNDIYPSYENLRNF